MHPCSLWRNRAKCNDEIRCDMCGAIDIEWCRFRSKCFGFCQFVVRNNEQPLVMQSRSSSSTGHPVCRIIPLSTSQDSALFHTYSRFQRPKPWNRLKKVFMAERVCWKAAKDVIALKTRGFLFSLPICCHFFTHTCPHNPPTLKELVC